MASTPPSTDGSDSGSLDSLERALGYAFRERGLLIEALTAGSHAEGVKGESSYERLEFLGDAVLQLVATHMIFEILPDATEGRMTDVRQHVVSGAALAVVARRLELGRYMRLGKGARISGDADRDSILSDIAEALLGAAFLDGGFDAASTIVRQHFDVAVRSAVNMKALDNDRSQLVKYAERRRLALHFDYEQFGPSHSAEFTASAVIEDEVVGVGRGASKKKAAAAASSVAIDALGLIRDR